MFRVGTANRVSVRTRTIFVKILRIRTPIFSSVAPLLWFRSLHFLSLPRQSHLISRRPTGPTKVAGVQACSALIGADISSAHAPVKVPEVRTGFRESSTKASS
jgi:hypothetical protein